MLIRTCSRSLMALALILAACGGDSSSPTAPSLPVPSAMAPPPQAQMSGPSGNSGCATVSFNVVGFPSAPATFTGNLTGDLEGTVVLTFVGGPGKFAGVTQQNGGIASWEITAGALGSLTFETEYDNKNIFIGDTLVENVGKHRAVDGVEKANLTYKGDFSFVTFLIDHDYRGVICP